MKTQIESINQRQLASKTPVITKEKTHYTWEDTSLIPLLSGEYGFLHPAYTDHETKDAEIEAIRIINSLILQFNNGLDYIKLENALEAEIDAHGGYVGTRIAELKHQIVDNAKRRKGILIYGEGGIGKTYFLYELAQELISNNLPYVIAFNQEGVMRLSEIGIDAIAESFPQGFTLMIDACNELDDDAFKTAKALIEETLQIENANVVATTRAESPTSRLSDLTPIFPSSLAFQGVNPYTVFDKLSECSDEIIVQFQDMLLSRNPRNLNSMLAMIRKFKPHEDGRNATTQRTALIENCIKDALSKRQWEQTKIICRFLFETNKLGFTKQDALAILGEEADSYLACMLEQGFIEYYRYDTNCYYFSSESQIRFVVARSLNDYFDQLRTDVANDSELADQVAQLVVNKSFYSNEHEMVQAAVDRYIKRGPEFISRLLSTLEQLGMTLNYDMLFSQTVFPLHWDFKGFAAQFEVDRDWAFLHLSGIPNAPFNLTNHVNDLFLADAALVDSFFISKWEDWQIAPLITRIQNITEFVSHTRRVPAAARFEWIWLSIWCSASTDIRLRAISQRLMFFLCDSDREALIEIIDAWDKVQDVYARRAITKAISYLSETEKRTKAVTQFVSHVRNDNTVTDSIVIANVCRIAGNLIAPTDFAARNYYIELKDQMPSKEEIGHFNINVMWIDSAYKDFPPFDFFQMQNGYIDPHYSRRFLSTPHKIIQRWNDSFRKLLKCKPGGECGGLILHSEDLVDYHPIGFKRELLDQRNLMNCMIALTKSWFEHYGGNLRIMLGEFKPTPPLRDAYITPNMKPFDLASHGLLGSLAANYYVNEIVVGGECYNQCGFCQYEEPAYNEPGVIHTCSPVYNTAIDSAKTKLERRIVSPEDKSTEWFNDTNGAFSDILRMLHSLKIGNIEWRPVAFSANRRIRQGSDLLWTNELIISLAFKTKRHINGDSNDRYLTIEHKTYEGNMKDYDENDWDLCLLLDAPDGNSVVTERNSILLPPPSIVKALNLAFEPKTMCFTDRKSGDPLIICDGAPGNYYEEPIHNLILMREDVYKKLVRDETLTYFAFTERYQKGCGYNNACDRHWEFHPDGTLINDNPNTGERGLGNAPEFCQGCYFSAEQREMRWMQKHSDPQFDKPDWLYELLDRYSPNIESGENNLSQ